MPALKQHLGLECISVDKFLPKAPKSTATKLDLTVSTNQQLVLNWIRLPQVKAVMLEPPCGTASMARNIELPNEPDLPQPLRSLLFPDGLPSLAGDDFARVQAANILDGFAAECWDLCCELNKPIMVENPKNSLFWFVTSWAERTHRRTFIQDHQACAYGSTRPKWTRLEANFSHVKSMNLTCPGDHAHEAWGVARKGANRVFATALEVHYPPQLCQAIARAFLMQLKQLGFCPPEHDPLSVGPRAFAGSQPATNKLPPLVSEFKTRFVVVYQHHKCCWPIQEPSLADAKLLHTEKMGDLVDMQEVHAKIHALCLSFWVGC